MDRSSVHHSFPRFGVVAAACIVAWSWNARAAISPCVDALAIDAPPALKARLTARLNDGALRAQRASGCSGTSVSLGEQGSEVHVALTRGGRRVERDVDSLEVAAVWLESWLVTGFDPESDDRTAVTRPPPVDSDAPPRRERLSIRDAADLGVTGMERLRLSAVGALGNDASMWTGAELGADFRVVRPVWLGVELGAFRDLGRSDGAVRSILSAAATGGFSVRLGRRFLLRPAIAVGIAAANSSSSAAEGVGAAGGTNADQWGAGFVGLRTDACVLLGAHLALEIGAGGRAYWIQGTSTKAGDAGGPPPPLTPLVAEARLGAAYLFGFEP